MPTPGFAMKMGLRGAILSAIIHLDIKLFPMPCAENPQSLP